MQRFQSCAIARISKIAARIFITLCETNYVYNHFSYSIWLTLFHTFSLRILMKYLSLNEDHFQIVFKTYFYIVDRIGEIVSLKHVL